MHPMQEIQGRQIGAGGRDVTAPGRAGGFLRDGRLIRQRSGPRECGRPRRPRLRVGADRPDHPLTGFLQHVLRVVANDQLAAVTFAVDLGAAVLVEVPRVARAG